MDRWPKNLETCPGSINERLAEVTGLKTLKGEEGVLLLSHGTEK